MLRRLCERSERGASSAEYAGLIVLAALIAAVLFTVIPTPVEDGVRDALCKIFHPGETAQCDKKPKAADEKYKPKTCTTKLAYNQYGVDLDVSFVRVGGNLTFIKTTTSDGKVTLTAVEGGKVGATASATAGIHLGKKLNIGGGASADASLNIGVGDGWTFNSDAEANKFIGDIKEHKTIDSVEKTGPLGWLGGHIYDTVAGPPKIPDPNITRYEGSVDLNGNGNLGLQLGPKPKEPEGKDRRSDKKISPNLGGYAGINGNEKVIYEKNSQTGQTSATFQLTGGANYGENHLTPDGHQGQVQTRGAMTLRTDKNGKLVGVDLAQTHIVNGNATVTTTTLPVTDENRERVARSLLLDNPAGPGPKVLALNWDNMVPDHDPGPNASEFEKELFKNGQVQKVDYNYSGDTDSYGADAKLGPFALGGAYNTTSSDQTVKDAQYLGAPGPDGKRRFVPFKECHA